MADKPNHPLAGLDTHSVLISQAENRDHTAAKELLEKASRYISEDKPLPPELASWISRGLHMLSEGADAKLAFKLAKKRGKPSDRSEEEERSIAEYIHWSRLGLHKGMNKEGSGMGAYLDAAIRFNITENTAEKFYKKHRDFILVEGEIRQELAEDNEVE